MNYRKYDQKKDKDAAFRILNECGWVHDKKKDTLLNDLLPSADTFVSTVNGEAEIIVHSAIGSIHYQDQKLQLSAITGVNASLLARKKGLTTKLTATKIAMDAEKGAEVSGLCIFDQGYYNKLGFGNGNYEHIVCFTPATLKINRKSKTPVRLTRKDYKIIHKNRKRRMLCHGSVTLPEFTTKAEMGDKDKNIGFGYFDKDGNLTHHLWFYGKGKEQGPIWIQWMAYENLDQLMDLLILLKSFEEQIMMIRMVEPTLINMQDFIEKPFLIKGITKNSKHQNYIHSSAFWQIRILNLQRCMKKTHLNCEDFSFNLQLTDPIEKFIPKEIKWKGVAGDYVVTLGNNSSAKKGKQKDLPTLKASVGAFTRLWFGIMPASSLVYSDGIQAPAVLIEKLDNAFMLPPAHIDWGF
ncbi:MAG: sterol carrier protein domain-containing protein [Candidatus Cloacimonadota bacterium]|nr:sterol carrier protein domain-containing protein [Candidatus Cloacimonadota bacterium]